MKFLILSLLVAAPPPLIDDSNLRPQQAETYSFTATLMVISLRASVTPVQTALSDPIFDATPEEREWIDIATHHCNKAAPRFAKPRIKLAMLRAEEAGGHGPHHPLRGNSLSWWCGESVYTFDAVGDDGRALGPLQLHTGYANLCLGKPYGHPRSPASDALRRDPVASTACMVAQVNRVASMTNCDGEKRDVVAEVWMARGKKPVVPRGSKLVLDCDAMSGHTVRLRRWQEIRDEHRARATRVAAAAD